ncbi:hypothetical protein AQUCO_01400729v1 [Aquilegia coerulea]|uniref:Uncharacterized protein n=1 Tax=Aquilegia coerulea TaxID=218851 RepID=A0A2G5DXT1_AQUCA|nr:hypothetical protein AQUCO_01400729v1 [Aquilegia coerulea]
MKLKQIELLQKLVMMMRMVQGERNSDSLKNNLLFLKKVSKNTILSILNKNLHYQSSLIFVLDKLRCGFRTEEQGS